MKKILPILVFIASLLIGYQLGIPKQQALGVALPQAAAVFETSLASPITSSATSMTLTANSVRGGGSLSGYNCFTIDEGSAQAEFTCGTVSSTAVTAMTRGVSPLTGTTTVAALQFAHRRGANVKITDFPLVQILKAQANGEDTYPNLLQYDSDVLISVGSPTTTIATKYYVDNTASAGAADANETTKGLVELATALESASSTSAGGTGALLALRAVYATDTPQSGCATGYTSTAGAGCTPIASLSGKLKQAWLDLTASFAWTGAHTFSSTVTITGATTMATSTTIGSGASGGLVPAGSVVAYATTTAPAGWLLCDGTSYATSTYPNLFTAIGYGYGGSSANFNVPDLRNRQITMASTTANIGKTWGEQGHTQTVAEMPAHTHPGSYAAGSGGATTGVYGVTNANTTASTNVISEGSGTAFNVLDPAFVMYYIIKY